ncbi:hypothetical protein A2U01_0031432 [Trifolium medium]|uniref:Uncharacterized protein n=1 Tax=Trifolium medium TaxID=97028 RepID=A0A392PFT4_9FABA|nr:hypothetical protein [Trifolium medium]
MADHVKRSRNLSPFDAIAPPKVTTKFGICWPAVPLDMTDDRRLRLTPLCKAALDKFNAENQVLHINGNSIPTVNTTPSGP